MFISKSFETILPIVRNTLTNPKIKEIFERLRKGAYHLSIVLSEEREMFEYRAYAYDDPFCECPFLSVGVDADGKPHSLDSVFSVRGRLSFEEHALYCYLVLWERDLFMSNPKKLKEIYAPYASKAADYLNSTPAERKKRRAVREDFLIFMSDQDKKEEASDHPDGNEPPSYQSQLSVVMSLERVKASRAITLSLSLCAESGLTEPVSDLSSFFDALLKGRPYVLGNRLFHIGAHNFTPEFYQTIPFLASLYYSGLEERNWSGERSSLFLDSGSINDFFHYAAGQEITYEGTPFYVSQTCADASASISDDEVLLHPPLSQSRFKTAIWSGRFAYVFNADIGVVERFRFPDVSNAKIYRYFALNPNASASDLSDLLKPYLQSVDAKDNAFEIRYFVDLIDAGYLSVRSDYVFMGASKTEEQLTEYPRYLQKINRFKRALSKHGMPSNGIVKNDRAVLSFLKADLSDLKKEACIYLSDRITQLKIRPVGSISIHLEWHTDWIRATAKHQEFTPSELKRILDAYKEKRSFLLLRGDVIVVDEEAKKLSKAKDELGLDDELENDALPLSRVFSLKEVDNSECAIDYEADVKAFIEDVIHYDRKEIGLPESIESIIRPYQRQGVQWLATLYDHRLGGVLADDMGLGKTLETIAFYSLLRARLPSLAIVPKSVLYNWEDEIHRYTPDIEAVIIAGPKDKRVRLIREMKEKKKRIYLVSYDSMRNDAAMYKDIQFDCVIADEAQFIKNAKAIKSKAIRTLKSNFKLALTGTPIENSMADLWSIFDFSLPGYLRSFPIFKTSFILAGNQVEARARLARMISPFLLRRTKAQVLTELPPKTTERLRIPMDGESRKFYDAVLQDTRAKRKELKERKGGDKQELVFSMLPLLTKLREICVDPASFFDGFGDASGKLVATSDIIANAIANNHRILIFSSFVRVLNHLMEILAKRGIASDMIYGDTDAKERLRLANEFNNSEGRKVMLVSLKAGGTGLNLHGADIVIHLDPWWNLAAEEQAQDRAHRIGQTRPVTVYKLYSYDTIEEKIFELQDRKLELYSTIIDGAANALRGMTEEDLDFLLG